MKWRTVPICELCWRDQEPDREPYRARGMVSGSERCYACGAPTDSGIWVRRLAELIDAEL